MLSSRMRHFCFKSLNHKFEARHNCVKNLNKQKLLIYFNAEELNLYLCRLSDKKYFERVFALRFKNS